MSRYSPEYQHRYPSLATSPWVRVIMARDGFRCVDCGREEGPIVSRIWWVTLCKPCHARRLGTVRSGIGIRALREKGYTMERIGQLFGISRQRVHQVCRKLTLDNAKQIL